jgi:hypothetical protein
VSRRKIIRHLGVKEVVPEDEIFVERDFLLVWGLAIGGLQRRQMLPEQSFQTRSNDVRDCG